MRHFPHSFFDGTSKNNLACAGIVLEIRNLHSFILKMGCGYNTKTRAKLLSLWSLLFFAEKIGIPNLFIVGDSSAVINWENEKATLSVLDLGCWCDKITSLKSSFLSLEFQHIYREHNQKADRLSMEALILASSLLCFTEFYEGHIIRGGETQIF